MCNRFAYINDDDKCYGLTGMVISLQVFDNETMVKEISLDKSGDDMLSFTPDFYFNSNPRFSAKIVWNEILKQYQLMIALLMGNVMCRYNVGMNKPVSSQDIEDMRHLVMDDGHDVCQLEDDEIDMLFDKTLRYLNGIYHDRHIHDLARGLVSVIKQRRTMSGDEIADVMRYLRNR